MMVRGLAVITLGAALCLAGAQAGAQAPAAKEPVKLDVGDGLQANLARRVGEKVEVILISGKSLTGTVKAVGTAGVHLSALEGKEFYDALVRIEQVSAVVVRAK